MTKTPTAHAEEHLYGERYHSTVHLEEVTRARPRKAVPKPVVAANTEVSGEAVERYVVNWVEQFGASLDPPGEIELMRVAFPGGEQLRVAPFTLRFPTRTALTVRLTAEQVGGTSVEVVTYAFHFRTPDGYCRNRHHVAEDGTEFHERAECGRNSRVRRGQQHHVEMNRLQTCHVVMSGLSALVASSGKRAGGSRRRRCRHPAALPAS